ncbi:MAG: fused MFS/spermidine synthase, partial [Desulfatibacillaceae bacterium]|nr:fused MFS/spermidine synthase [Desulfatibacillaceae bacterium]
MESQKRFLETFVYFLFVVSGACSLIYQLVWVRIFSLEFGSTTLGVATVVAVFLGGLAAGALVGGKISARLKRPLAAYGAIELTLTAFVALSPWTIAWALSTLLNAAGPLVHGSFGLLTLLRFFAAVALLAPPTLLMGATLPVLSTWMEQRAGQGSYRASSLYSWNTFGATIGVAFGGFWLLPQVGMQKSLLIAASANLFIAVFCLVAGSRIAPAREIAAPKKTGPVKDAPVDKADPRLLLGGIGIALAGAAAMICQVVWTRVATLVLGASVYSFTVVLGVFLAGLALGALFVTWACHKKHQSTGAVLQALLMGGAVAIIATGYVFSFLPAWAVGLHSPIRSGAGAFSLLQLQLAIAAALLFVPVLILGGIFPAALLALARETKAIGSEVGRLYAWNIAGSVSGVLLAGFILLPLFGVSISLGWAASLL